jgi:hypothetical protein
VFVEGFPEPSTFKVLTPKVFGIGFHKTGTSSLAQALRLLGYRVCGPVGQSDPHIGERALEIALPYVHRYDAFQDNPWPLLYREMDRMFPGSKFVLTHRDMDGWIRSAVTFFGRRGTPMRRWIYGPEAGSPVGNEELYVARHQAHVAEVLDHFRDRPGALLVLRVVEGEGWDKLCPFLGLPIPDIEFPHAVPKPRRGTLGSRVDRWRRPG